MARKVTAMKLYVGDDINAAEEVLTSVNDMIHMAVNRRECFEDILKDSAGASIWCFNGSVNGKTINQPITDGKITVIPDEVGITIWGRNPKDVLSFCLLYSGKDLTDFPDILREYEYFSLPDKVFLRPRFREKVFSILRRELCSSN